MEKVKVKVKKTGQIATVLTTLPLTPDCNYAISWNTCLESRRNGLTPQVKYYKGFELEVIK